jgi:hypothetical protein
MPGIEAHRTNVAPPPKVLLNDRLLGLRPVQPRVVELIAEFESSTGGRNGIAFSGGISRRFDDCLLTAVRNFVLVLLEAGNDSSASGLNARANLFNVACARRANLFDRLRRRLRRRLVRDGGLSRRNA